MHIILHFSLSSFSLSPSRSGRAWKRRAHRTYRSRETPSPLPDYIIEKSTAERTRNEGTREGLPRGNIRDNRRPAVIRRRAINNVG